MSAAHAAKPGPGPADAPHPLRPGGARWQEAIILAVSLVTAVGVLALLNRLSDALALLFLGILIGQALIPPIEWVARWLPRSLAVLLIYSILIAAVVFAIWLVVPTLYVQARDFVDSAPGLIDRAHTWLNHVLPGQAGKVEQSFKSPLVGLSHSLLTLPLTVASVGVKFVMVIFFSIYWVLSAPALNRFALSLIPDEHRQDASALFDELGAMLGGYVRGDVLDAVLIGTIAYGGMMLLGVRFALVLGVVTALGDLIPLVGPTIAQFLATGVALTQSPKLAVITLVFFLILQQVDGNITLPTITRGIARIPPLLILFGLVAGGMLGGVLGAVIAIPLSGAIRLLLVRVAAPVLRDWWGTHS